MNKALIALLLSSSYASAAIINAASTSYIDVSNAVAVANAGDTVQIPAGSSSWTAGLTIQGITVSGQSSNLTTIVDETFHGDSIGIALFNVITTNGFLTRVTNMKLQGGVTNTTITFSVGTVNISGTNPSVRIDHMMFYNLPSKPIVTQTQCYGIIDDCTFYAHVSAANMIEAQGNVYGDDSWASTYTPGTTNALYIESCYCSSADSFSAFDFYRGVRAVIRYNTFVGTFLSTHGTESGGRNRSVRALEVYNNNFHYSDTIFNNFGTVMQVRGGTAYIFSNTTSQFYSMTTFTEDRATDNQPGFFPWWGATGTNAYDPNVRFGNAISVANSNCLVVAGTPWSINQFYGYSIFNVQSNLCGLVASNTANTMYFTPSRFSVYQIGFKVGDSNLISYIHPMIDEPGAGKGDLLVGNGAPTNAAYTYGTITNAHQAIEPVYSWSNTVSVNFIPAFISKLSTQLGNLTEGIDFSNAPLTGYTPLAYPYPGLNSSGGGTGTNTINTGLLLGNVGHVSFMH